MKQFFTSREEYIAVLQNEAEILRRYYYKPQTSGTGHFNTAIGVLEQRIEELQRMSDAAQNKYGTMTDDADDLKSKLEAHKPKKKKLAVPEGFLEEAKSYEGKLMAVRIIAEREKGRVLLMFKGMIAKADEDRAKLAAAQEKAKREAEQKEALARAALIAKNKAKKK